MRAEDWARFLKCTEAQASCVVWTGSRTRAGYGHMSVGNKVQYAHRLCYEHFSGEIPAGMYVRHLCDNRPCVSPFHLEIGTPSQNRFDMAPELRRAMAVAREAKKSPEERKQHAAKMRAARSQEGIRRGALKMTAARMAQRSQPSPEQITWQK